MKTILRYILVSDDVRKEDNGKLMVIGLHGHEILVTRLPITIPLAFTAGIVFEGEGAFDLSGKLRHSESGDELLTFGATGAAKKSGSAYVPFKFPMIQLKDAGVYQVVLAVKGQDDVLTESFAVKTLDQ